MVFILFFQGDQLRSRVRKICEGFRATLYQCPETAAEREEMTVAVDHRIHDLNSVLETTEDHSNKQFRDIALEIDVWQTKVHIIIWLILLSYNYIPFCKETTMIPSGGPDSQYTRQWDISWGTEDCRLKIFCLLT